MPVALLVLTLDEIDGMKKIMPKIDKKLADEIIWQETYMARNSDGY